MQVSALRERLLTLGVHVVVSVRRIVLHLPTVTPSAHARAKNGADPTPAVDARAPLRALRSRLRVAVARPGIQCSRST
jgi:hypothetical protein